MQENLKNDYIELQKKVMQSKSWFFCWVLPQLISCLLQKTNPFILQPLSGSRDGPDTFFGRIPDIWLISMSDFR